MSSVTIEEVTMKVAPALKEYGVVYAAVFGSVSRGEAKADSDVDLLVRLGRPMGMFSYMRFINFLEKLLGRKVDVVTESSMSPFMKPYILPDLKTIYEN